MMKHRALVALSFLSALVLLPVSAGAFGNSKPGLFMDDPQAITPAMLPKRTAEKEPPVVLHADEVGYDHENHIVIALGNVEVQQGEYIVLADKITYFQDREVVVAEGNVSMLQPSGDVFFADRTELRNSLKTGVIDEFRARFADNSVLTATKAEKENPAVTRLMDAAYTPCTVCESFAPFWQLNAEEARIDDLEERMTYKNATMEFGGIPLFYMPYLSAPTSGAEAKSGFMPPQYGNNANLGSLAKVPYYWRIAHDREALITTWYSSQEGLLLQGDYRQLADRGTYEVQATATNPAEIDSAGNAVGGREFRGHIFAKGDQWLDDDIRAGFDINRASDDTYLRRYGLGDQPLLFSRLYTEAAQGRSYALAQGLSIQGLRATDNSATTPYVLPDLQAYYETRPEDNGLRYHVGGNMQMLGREQGIDQQRLSITTGATLPYVTDGGHIFTSTLNVRQDIYRTQNIAINSITQDVNTYRVLPQAALEWRYPLIQGFGKDSWTIEPIVLGVLQSNGGNPATISNEDSKLLELSDTNLFSLDRMPGLDLIDSGPRAAYGVRSQYLFSTGTSIEGMLGQNYNAADTPFPNSTRPDEAFSDYIGRIDYTVQPISLSYRFALDNEQLTANRQQVAVQYSMPWLFVRTIYNAIDNNNFIADSKEGRVDFSVPLTDNWSIRGGAQRNFMIDQFVSTNGGIVYMNECFNISLDIQRNYTRDRDVEPTTMFMLRLALKNLGEYGYGGTVSTTSGTSSVGGGLGGL